LSNDESVTVVVDGAGSWTLVTQQNEFLGRLDPDDSTDWPKALLPRPGPRH